MWSGAASKTSAFTLGAADIQNLIRHLAVSNSLAGLNPGFLEVVRDCDLDGPRTIRTEMVMWNTMMKKNERSL